jgi:hypothetical protein
MLDLHRVLQPRTKPAAEQVCLRRRSGHADSLHVRDAGPQRRQLRSPAARPGPRNVGHGDAVEDLGQPFVAPRQIGPLGAVDDQPVGDVYEPFELRLAERRQTAPAQERRQVREQQRLHDARRRRRAAALQAHSNRLGADRTALAYGMDVDVDLPLETVRFIRLGD